MRKITEQEYNELCREICERDGYPSFDLGRILSGQNVSADRISELNRIIKHEFPDELVRIKLAVLVRMLFAYGKIRFAKKVDANKEEKEISKMEDKFFSSSDTRMRFDRKGAGIESAKAIRYMLGLCKYFVDNGLYDVPIWDLVDRFSPSRAFEKESSRKGMRELKAKLKKDEIDLTNVDMNTPLGILKKYTYLYVKYNLWVLLKDGYAKWMDSILWKAADGDETQFEREKRRVFNLNYEIHPVIESKTADEIKYRIDMKFTVPNSMAYFSRLEQCKGNPVKLKKFAFLPPVGELYGYVSLFDSIEIVPSKVKYFGQDSNTGEEMEDDKSDEIENFKFGVVQAIGHATFSRSEYEKRRKFVEYNEYIKHNFKFAEDMVEVMREGSIWDQYLLGFTISGDYRSENQIAKNLKKNYGKVTVPPANPTMRNALNTALAGEHTKPETTPEPTTPETATTSTTEPASAEQNPLEKIKRSLNQDEKTSETKPPEEENVTSFV